MERSPPRTESKQPIPINKMPRTLTPKLKEHLVAIGKKGGVSTSEKKRLAAIENGKKGGRPKKQIPATA